MADLSEFSLIQHYFEQLSSPRNDVALGIGDDCALLNCPSDQQLAVSIDTLVEGVHFFADVSAENLGHKSLAVGLSDLAAMGAKPAWFTLALTLPKVDKTWLSGFSQGLAKLANQYQLQLIGGDTTKGPLTISIQVHGFVPADKALKRHAAKVGDIIYVTGTLGDAGAALQLRQNKLSETVFSDDDEAFLQQRLERPSARVVLGQKLAGVASAAIDISDGLIADLAHITQKSQLGARLDLTALPLSPALQQLPESQAIELALYSGDDYELCFCAPADNSDEIEQRLQGQYRAIGVITDDVGIYSIENDQLIELIGTGYDHFR